MALPTLYTTYYRAIQYIPNPRYTISYVLVQPKSPSDIERIKQQVAALGYLAHEKGVHKGATTSTCLSDRGGTNILIMTVISFIVGLSISGQTFYTFILENLERFGALKAIGTKSRELVGMILFQATFTALTGFGLGVGLCTLSDLSGQAQAAELCGHDHLSESASVARYGGRSSRRISSYFGVRRVLRIEPFDIFRG